MLLENEVCYAKKYALLQRFGLPVLMCVDYISALKVATSYKFLFIGFLSIKYSVEARFVSLALLSLCICIFCLYINMLLFFCCRVAGRAERR